MAASQELLNKVGADETRSAGDEEGHGEVKVKVECEEVKVKVEVEAKEKGEVEAEAQVVWSFLALTFALTFRTVEAEITASPRSGV